MYEVWEDGGYDGMWQVEAFQDLEQARTVARELQKREESIPESRRSYFHIFVEYEIGE